MRLMFRSDSNVAILAFSTTFPEASLSLEVARMYTSISHLRAISNLLKKNLEAYDSGKLVDVPVGKPMGVIANS